MEGLRMGVRRGDGICVAGEHMRSQQSRLLSYRRLVGENCFRSVCIWYRADDPNEAIKKFIRFYMSSEFERI